MTNTTYCIKTLILAAMVLLFSTPGIGLQPVLAEDGYYALEEVIVTARKRQESIQDTPIAITALDKNAIAEANVRSLEDVSQFVPGLRLTKGASGGAVVFVRGIGQRDNRVTLEPGAAVYVDGIYLARQEGSLLNTLDIASIQVLRGPQGSLFGKNTISGAVLVESVKPGAEPGAFVEGRLGNYDRRDVRVGVNLPLSDALLSRVSYSSQKHDGFMENVVPGKDDGSDENKQAAIAQLRWLASEDLVVDFSAFWSQQEEAGHGLKCRFDTSNSQQSGFTLPAALSRADQSVLDAFEAACLRSEYGLDEFEFASDLNGVSDLDTGSAALTIAWDVGDVGFASDGEFKSISSWTHQSSRYSRDFDGTELRLFTTVPSDPYRSDQMAQEFQFTGSALDESLQFTSGLYFYNDESKDGIEENVVGPYLTVIPAFVLYNGDPVQVVSNTPTLKETDTDSLAVYFQGTYDLNDYLALTAGLRYTREDKRVSGVINTDRRPPGCTLQNGCALNPIAGGTGGVPPSPTYVSQTREFDAVTPMLNLTLRPDQALLTLFALDDGMLYLTYSAGFKSGGFNFDQSSLSLQPFDQEEVDNYEIGIKLDALDNRLRFNAALFYMDYTDIQLTTAKANPDTSTSVVIVNAGEAAIAGYEMELTWMPLAKLLIALNGTCVDADIKEFIDTIGDPDSRDPLTGVPLDRITIDRKDEEFTNTPDYTLTLTVSYDWALGWATIIPRLDIYREGTTYNHFDRGSWVATQKTGLFKQQAYTLINARLSFMLADGHSSVSLWGKNLSDEFYYTGGTGVVDVIGAGTGFAGEPRTYGVDLRYEF